MAKTHLNLFDIKRFSIENDGLGLIIKLQDFGALPKEIKCVRGHTMRLVHEMMYWTNINGGVRKRTAKKKTTCNYR